MKRLLSDMSRMLYLYTAITSMIMSFLLWVAQLLRYINFMTSVDLDAVNAIEISVLLVPESISVALPFSFAIAVGIVYTRLRSTNQITALFCMGARYELVLRPILHSCLMVSAIFYVNAFYIAPECLHRFYSFKQEFNDTFVLPSEGSVINYQNVSFFIGSKRDNNTVYDVIVHDKRNKSSISTLMADKATIASDKNKIMITLNDGNRMMLKNRDLSKITFSEYKTFINKKNTKSAKQYNEKLFHELVSSTLRKDQAVLHQKITVPLSMMICGLLVGLIIVSMEFSRGVNALPYIKVVLLVAGMQLVGTFIMRMSMSAAIANILFYLFYGVVLFKLRRSIKAL